MERIIEQYPLQNRKLKRLLLPYASIGTCEVMNASPYCFTDAFHVYNKRNRAVYTPAGVVPSSFMGEMIGGGLMDSYTGATVSRFLSSILSRSLSLHTIVQSELRALRTELREDPIVDLMIGAASHNRSLHAREALTNSSGSSPFIPRVVTGHAMQQYALSADTVFFQACEDLERASSRTLGTAELGSHAKLLSQFLNSSNQLTKTSREVRESGCCGVWFTATVAPSALDLQRYLALHQRVPNGLAPPPRRTLSSAADILAADAESMQRMASQYPFCLDVMVSSLGDTRAFGIARNAHTYAKKSLLDPARERVVPFTEDHRPLRPSEFRRITLAGGLVESAKGEVIDGNPFYNVSRSFGHWKMKCDRSLSPIQQKIIALPTSKEWEMLPGDVLVLTNHAVFEARGVGDTTIDELAKVVGREVDLGMSSEQVAATLCDYAMRFGAKHSLQAMVMIATSPKDTGHVDPQFQEWVEPGPLYVEACMRVSEYREALGRDCERCGIDLEELLRLRWDRIHEALALRHQLPLRSLYGKECGQLSQLMEEEAAFFDGAYQRSCSRPAASEGQFHMLAKSLLHKKNPPPR